MLTPADIVKKEFTQTRIKAGYDQVEVDDYLDRIKGDYEHVLTLLEEAERQRRDRAKAETVAIPALADSATPLKSAEKLLIVAQQTADNAVMDAQAEARGIVTNAEAQAASLVSDAQAQAKDILGSAHAEREQRVAELDEQIGFKEQSVAELDEHYAEYRKFLLGALGSFNRALDEGRK